MTVEQVLLGILQAQQNCHVEEKKMGDFLSQFIQFCGNNTINLISQMAETQKRLTDVEARIKKLEEANAVRTKAEKSEEKS
jgi:hypothetical protein